MWHRNRAFGPACPCRSRCLPESHFPAYDPYSAKLLSMYLSKYVSNVVIVAAFTAYFSNFYTHYALCRKKLPLATLNLLPLTLNLLPLVLGSPTLGKVYDHLPYQCPS